MASRDNQTTQIVIIAMALTLILLIVGLVMINNARKTAVARAKDADAQATESRSAQNLLQAEANNYKLMIGYPEADTRQTLDENFKEDMERWGSNFEESNRSFRNIVDNIFDENRKLAQSESDAKDQLKKLKQELLATEAQKNDQIAKYQAEAQKAQADKESLRNQFAEAREQIEEEKKKIATQLAEQREKIDTLVAEADATQKALQDKIGKLDRVIEILKSNQVIPDPYAQPADGEIVYVDQKEGRVWLNLGSADELRPQVTFSVYTGDSNDVNAADTKGSVEVVRLLSAHMAEARITNDAATRPLMPGDKVYSQVWNRGRQVGFAVTGVVDMDGDGDSDIEQLKRIIELNNGKIDAIPGAGGGIDGQMTVDTRYLILGKHPSETRGTSPDARQSYQRMSEEADTLNIEVITLDDFLSLMGWQAEHHAVKVGKGARAEDFPARAERDFKPRTLNSSKDMFRQRKPLPAY